MIGNDHTHNVAAPPALDPRHQSTGSHLGGMNRAFRVFLKRRTISASERRLAMSEVIDAMVDRYQLTAFHRRYLHAYADVYLSAGYSIAAALEQTCMECRRLYRGGVITSRTLAGWAAEKVLQDLLGQQVHLIEVSQVTVTVTTTNR